MADLRAGDTLAVRCLDCLGRSLKRHIETLTVQIDKTKPGCKLVFHDLGALAGLVAARAR